MEQTKWLKKRKKQLGPKVHPGARRKTTRGLYCASDLLKVIFLENFLPENFVQRNWLKIPKKKM